MRTLFAALVLAAATAAALAQPAAAKEMEAELRSGPAGASAGKPWIAVFSLVGVAEGKRFPIEGAAAGVEIRNEKTGEQRYFSAAPTKEAGVYRARVLFPNAGRWSYTVTDGVGLRRELGSVEVGARRSGARDGRPAAQPSPGSFPVVPLAGGVLLALTLAGGAAFLLLRQRPGIRSSRPA